MRRCHSKSDRAIERDLKKLGIEVEMNSDRTEVLTVKVDGVYRTLVRRL